MNAVNKMKAGMEEEFRKLLDTKMKELETDFEDKLKKREFVKDVELVDKLEAIDSRFE